MTFEQSADSVGQNISMASSPRARVAPKVHPTISAFLDQRDLLHSLVDGFGSPLNLVFPDIVAENIQRFKGVFSRYHLEGEIFFTTKPNKSHAIKRRASLESVMADVSSEQALVKILAAGFAPERVEATGPKSYEYLSLALQLGVIINVDNFEELKALIELRRSLKCNKPTRIFVRLSGFFSTRISFTRQDGTFGIDVRELADILAFLKRYEAELDFWGFSYHVSDANPEQRVVIIEQTLSCTLEAIKAGLQPQGLNIGGGFRIQYADSATEWASYIDCIKRSLVERSEQLTWNDGGLGYRVENGVVTGAPNFMDHYTGLFAEKDLEKVLTSQLPDLGGETAASIMAEVPLKLFIEPGRALLDQLGISVGRVSHVKRSVQGELLVVLEMNRSNLHSTHQKLLTEPLLISRSTADREPCGEGVYYVGNLCVSYDIIQYNKTFPQYMPRPGDLVVFMNTSPYMMDFIESNTLHQRLARKVAITQVGSEFRFAEDESYHPLTGQIFDRHTI